MCVLKVVHISPDICCTTVNAYLKLVYVMFIDDCVFINY